MKKIHLTPGNEESSLDQYSEEDDIRDKFMDMEAEEGEVDLDDYDEEGEGEDSFI